MTASKATSKTTEEQHEQSKLEIKIKSEYEQFTDPQTPEEYRSMKESIRTSGQEYPIVVNQHGYILDGHHRYKSCKELGIEPWYEVRETEGEEADYDFIYNANAERRNYTELQRIAQVRRRWKAILEKRARENMSLAGKTRKQQTFTKSDKPSTTTTTKKSINVQEECAKKAKVSKGTWYKGEYLLDSEWYKTDPEFKRLCDTGRKKIDEAFHDIKREQRRADTKARVEADARALNLPSRDGNGKVMLLNEDSTKVEELTEIPDNSIDLIVTDPPYAGKTVDEFFTGLARFASQKLKEGGSIVFYFGQLNLPAVLQIFSQTAPNLTYWWMFCVKHTGHIARFHARGVHVGWKGMLWFVKGEDKTLMPYDVDDFIVSSPPDKNIHEWAQSSVEAEHVIKSLTISEHSVVCDPFLGSGTFGIPAIKMGRWFIGIEIDREKYEVAKNYILRETAATTGTAGP